jgi:hypothetical protein
MKGNCLTKGAFNLPSRFMRLRGSLKSIGNDQTLPVRGEPFDLAQDKPVEP